MKTVKPLKLAVLHRTFEQAGRCYFVPTVLLFFGFEAPTVPLQEVHLWKLVGAELGPEAPLDEGMPKPRGEVLVTGKAYPPGGIARPACAVRLQLGPVDKQLYVVGRRRWVHGAPTEPEPFREMPLAWSHAFGGEGFDRNPLGMGVAPVRDPDGAERHPLPHIESPKELLTSPGQRPTPAGLAPIPLTWPQRFRKVGSYGAAWLKNGYPGLADDLDPTFFQVAPEDQWLPGYFRGDERFVLEHMHPTLARQESRLPGMRARCFITRDAEALREIELHIDTVHLFPHRQRGIVVFRGVTEVREDDAADVTHLCAAAEALGAALPVSHYARVLRERLDKKTGALRALRDADLMPPRDPAAPPMAEEELGAGTEEALHHKDQLLVANMRRRAAGELERAREKLRAEGVDPAKLGVPEALPPAAEPPALDALVEHVEDLKAEAAARQADAERERERALAEVKKACAEQGLDFEALLAKREAEHAGPPKFRAAAELARLLDQAELARNAGMSLPHVTARLADPELRPQLEATERQLRETYRKFAQHFPAARRLAEGEAARVRAEVTATLGAGGSLAGADLTGATLAGLSFAGADLRGAFLEAADLSGCDFRGADLTDAVLARADLSRACFVGAKVKGASFGAAKLHGTDLSGGLDLGGAVFGRADLAGANLCDAVLDRNDFLDATFGACDFSGVRGSRLNFVRADLGAIDLRGVCFRGATLRASNFLSVDVEGVDFSGADLEGSVFLATRGARANFDGARCRNLRVVERACFAGATFRGATLTGANLRGTDLRGCDLSGAELSGADLCEANLEAAKLERVVAPRALFIRTNLRNARLAGANLMEAIVQKADLRGADFRDSNLFRADFAKIEGDAGTSFAGANMGFIRFVERRPHGQV